MSIKVLLQTRNTDFAAAVTECQKNYDIKKITVLQQHVILDWYKNATRHFDVLAVDKWFWGSARETAGLVQLLRKSCKKPFIAVDVCAGDGDIISLQVAGCNFVLPASPAFANLLTDPDATRLPYYKDLANQLLGLIEKIEVELGRSKRGQMSLRRQKTA